MTAVLLATAPLAAMAQDPLAAGAWPHDWPLAALAETEAETEAGAGAGPVARLVQAILLQDAAETAQDALGLGLAADIASKVQLRQALGWQMDEAKVTPLVAPPTPQPRGMAPGAALGFLQSGEAMAAALLMAEEDDEVSDLLIPLAGAQGWHHSGAATVAEASLPPGGAQVWQLPFDGQSPAEISVLTLTEGRAAWRVLDAAGDELCPTQAAEAPHLCRFTPEVNSYVAITIEAATAAKDSPALRYMLLTN